MANKNLQTSATIKDVARAAGVSHATVSRVINNSANVSAEKRQRILDAMDALDYVPNLQARSLAGGRTQVIGLLVPHIGSGYIGSIFDGIDAEISARDFDIMLHTTHHRKVRETIYVQSLTHGMAEGLLLLLPVDPSAYLEGLRKENFPYVVIDHQGFDTFSPTVASTNRQGAYEATSYLVSLGHRRIGFVTGSNNTSSAQERFDGYKDSLDHHQLPYDANLVAFGNFLQQSGYRAALKLLDLAEPPTAIFAANDFSAMGVIDAARERGLRIPQDISIMGFDDIPQAAWMNPALTTVSQPLFEMGRRAAKMLLEYIEDPTAPTQRLQLLTELRIRDTCAPPRTDT